MVHRWRVISLAVRSIPNDAPQVARAVVMREMFSNHRPNLTPFLQPTYTAGYFRRHYRCMVDMDLDNPAAASRAGSFYTESFCMIRASAPVMPRRIIMRSHRAMQRRCAHMSRSCFCRAMSLRGRRVWVPHGDQLIVYFLDSFLYFIINRNPITQKPYGGYHSTDRYMRGRRVWVLHGDQLIVYFLDSFLYFIINRNPITQKPYRTVVVIPQIAT